MNPDEHNSRSGGALNPSSRPNASIVPQPRDPSVVATQREAATNVIRNQIDSLYGGQTVAPVAQPAPATTTTAVSEDPNPYARTHSTHPQPQADQWKQYHSAWQQYYQKYYEGYYANQPTEPKAVEQTQAYFGSQSPAVETPESISKDEALHDLREKLIGRVQESAQKARKSRHFVPIFAASLVVLLFAFLQYNQVIFGAVAAYVSPGSIDVQNIVVDPSNDVAVSDEPRLIIPKINVDVPVAYDVGNDYDSQMKAMETGVAHFAIPGASSHPGEIGNTAIAGHSSNDLFGGGDYKFIFAQLDKLTVGDTIYANYKGVRYSYIITNTQVVLPTEVSAITKPTTKPMITLITCTPFGTALKRLLITAEQVSPDPLAASAAPIVESTGDATLPGQGASTLLEKLFGQ